MYLGIVEDNSSDPLNLGRCKVRIFGLHTEDKDELPTADLPWCAMISSNVGNISEVSNFSVPEQGTWVVITFLDKELQQPISLGSLTRYEAAVPSSSEGFSDPDGVYPKESNLNRTSISRIATGSSGVLSEKPTAITATEFTEPASEFSPIYPDNKVIQTKSGHVIELDDTSGAERIQVMHKSGSFLEMHPDGKMVVHTKGANYQISESTLNIYGNGDINIESEGDINIESGADINMASSGDINMTAPTTVIVTTPTLTASAQIQDVGGIEGTLKELRDDYEIHTHDDINNSLAAFVTIYNSHTHDGVTSGSSDTDEPNELV